MRSIPSVYLLTQILKSDSEDDLGPHVLLKRKKQTFFLSLDRTSGKHVVEKLHSVIKSIGGLGGDEGDNEAQDEQDIDIPVPSFETNDSDDDEDENKVNNVKSSKNKIIPDIEDIILGEPRDRNDPYGSGFVKVKNMEKSLGLHNFAIMAFRLKTDEGDDFDVVEPTDAEE